MSEVGPSPATADAPAHPWYGFYADLPCMGCSRLFGMTDPTFRLCSDCRCEHLEALAHRIDPNYDQGVEHEWIDVARVLWRLGICPEGKP